MFKTIGYARATKCTEHLEQQLKELKDDHCQMVFFELCRGKLDEQNALQCCIEFVNNGDVLTVCDINILGETLDDIKHVLYLLDDKGVLLNLVSEKGMLNTYLCL
jgi:DNA invertase Pin-like site-specific DNA recombinase